MKLANRLCKDTKVNSTSILSLPVRDHQEDSETQTIFNSNTTETQKTWITNKEMQEKFDSQKQTTLKRQSEYFQVCSALGLDAFYFHGTGNVYK